MNISQLHKYFCDECTEEERRAVEHWVSESQENREFMHTLRQIWDVEPRDEFQPDMTAGYQQIEKRLQQATPVTQNVRPLGSKSGVMSKKIGSSVYRKKHVKTYAAAVAATIILLVTVLMVVQNRTVQPDSRHVELQKIETDRGERTSFILADGSKVFLNADSRLEISSEFNTGLREVYLQGEAYFDVTSDLDRPFIIYSKQTYTRVLGTKFGISAYPDVPKVQTVVEEGRVLFGIQSDSTAIGQEIELRRNDLAEIKENSITAQKHLPDSIAAQYLGWKEGKLVFVKTPLKQIIPKLERWYDITLDLETSRLGERLLTATFQDEPLTEILNVISLSLDLNYTRKSAKRIVFSNMAQQDRSI